jgi:hypothetical protein
VAESGSDAILPVYTLTGEVLSWQAGSRTTGTTTLIIRAAI